MMAAGATRLAAMLALMFCATTAFAQTYPTRPIRIVVPYAAGSTTDLQGRMIADVLAESMGQPVIVENRAGASDEGWILAGLSRHRLHHQARRVSGRHRRAV